jgi:hypothetical protein
MSCSVYKNKINKLRVFKTYFSKFSCFFLCLIVTACGNKDLEWEGKRGTEKGDPKKKERHNPWMVHQAFSSNPDSDINYVRSFLEKVLRVVLLDNRVVTGRFVALDGEGEEGEWGWGGGERYLPQGRCRKGTCGGQWKKNTRTTL